MRMKNASEKMVFLLLSNWCSFWNLRMMGGRMDGVFNVKFKFIGTLFILREIEIFGI
jgi:hypothetical protein